MSENCAYFSHSSIFSKIGCMCSDLLATGGMYCRNTAPFTCMCYGNGGYVSVAEMGGMCCGNVGYVYQLQKWGYVL